MFTEWYERWASTSTHGPVAAAAIDGGMGDLFQAGLTPAHGHIRDCLRELPGPVAVAHEAGPTGFDPVPVVGCGGDPVRVVAPSKLQHPVW